LELLTVNEAAELLGVHKTAIYQAIRERRLEAVMVLGRKGLHRQDVLAYKERTAEGGKQGGRPTKKAGTDTKSGQPGTAEGQVS